MSIICGACICRVDVCIYNKMNVTDIYNVYIMSYTNLIQNNVIRSDIPGALKLCVGIKKDNAQETFNVQ